VLDDHAGRAVPRPLDLAIGCVPMRLHFPGEDLRSQSLERYEGFCATVEPAYPIRFESPAPVLPHSADFSYQFEGASLRCDKVGAFFSGVRHAYALDTLLRILLSWVLLPRTGFLLHAATVVRQGRAYVFAGRSGAGKSTVASLAPAGSVLTDEISLLRYEEGQWRAHGTPFWGEFRAAGSNTSAPVAGFFRLIQSPRNSVRAMRPAEALRALLPNVLFFSTDTSANRRLLDILTQADEQVPSYHLDFQRTQNFWEVLPA
jgi:hypothetical protein